MCRVYITELNTAYIRKYWTHNVNESKMTNLSEEAFTNSGIYLNRHPCSFLDGIPAIFKRWGRIIKNIYNMDY